jgi:hypothetical protein
MSERGFFPPVIAAWRTARSELALGDSDLGPDPEAFLKAVQMLAKIDAHLGKIFAVWRRDTLSNVMKVRGALKASTGVTIQDLLRQEVSEQRQGDETSASMGMKWLDRELHFMFSVLEKLSQGIETHTAAQEAYEVRPCFVCRHGRKCCSCILLVLLPKMDTLRRWLWRLSIRRCYAKHSVWGSWQV